MMTWRDDIEPVNPAAYGPSPEREREIEEMLAAGRAEDERRWARQQELWEAQDPANAGPGYTFTGRDWHAVRAAEATARETGLRVSVPRPEGRSTPEYEADAAAWGTGRGVGTDGPEVGS